MKQLVIEIEDDLAERLEEVAPSRSRRRSDFIRRAIRRAIWELEEKATAEAYTRVPDRADDVYVDASVWESPSRGRVGQRKK